MQKNPTILQTIKIGKESDKNGFCKNCKKVCKGAIVHRT